MEFIPGIQGFFSICKSTNVIHHTNKLKNKREDHLNICRKSFWQSSTSIYDKNSPESRVRGNYLNIIKAIYDKPTANIIFNSEKLKAFFCKIRNKTRMSTLITFIQHSSGSPSHHNQRRKRNKRNTKGERKVKQSLFADDMTLYIKNP